MTETTYEGYWWPAGVEEQTPGRLVMGEDRITLSLNGRFPGDPLVIPDHPVVYGIAGSRRLTLRGCWGTSTSFGTGVPSQTYVVGTVWSGVHAREFTVAAVALRLEHLFSWSGAIGPKQASTDARGRTAVAWQVHQSGLEVRLPDAAVKVVIAHPGTGGLDAVTLRTEVWFEVEPTAPLPYDVLDRRYIRPLQNLITLAAGRAIAITGLNLELPSDAELSGTPPPHLAEVRSTWLVRPAAEPRPMFAPEMTFTLSSLSDPSASLEKWLRVHEELAPACDLFFGNHYAPPRFVSGRFLNHCQAADGYSGGRFLTLRMPKDDHERRMQEVLAHLSEADRDWVKPALEGSNRRSFRELIAELARNAPPVVAPIVGDPAEFAGMIRDFRNALAHGGEHPDPDTLLIADRRLRLLLHAWFMRELGMTDDVIAAGLANSRVMQEVRHFLKAPSV